ncbi:MAG: sodium:calcium antiporter [Deltaproteobacteria bacterium]|nr:sodium:calcium antiporter [Deltaproteobacteria bacterium]
MLWLGFAACTAVIVIAGTFLSRYGDIIALKSGLGRTWIGVVLMATVTSLPEFVTGLSAVTHAGAPDIAVGDVLGSCVFNMLIVAFLDFFHGPQPTSTKAHHGNTLAAGFGILLLIVAALGLFLSGRLFPIGWIGPCTLVLPGLYLLAMRLVFVYEKKRIAALARESAGEPEYKGIPWRTVLLHFGASAAAVVAAAVFLPAIGKGIAASTGLGQTFVGNILISVSTSLPEVVVSIAAVRMGSIDLAIGGLFGSNLVNVGIILAADDLFFARGPILSLVDPAHLVSALSATAMTAIAVIGLTYRAEKKRLVLAWDSIGILAVYILNFLILSPAG